MEQIQSFDRNILDFLYKFAISHPIAEFISQIFALATIYLVPLILLCLWFRKDDNDKNKIVALDVLFAGIIGWQVIAGIVKQFIFRARPFENGLISVNELVFHRPDQSFPSDHASLIFAVTFMLYFLKQYKLANLTLIAAILVSLARIATGLHYPSDILGGVVVGFMVAFVMWLVKKPFEKYIARPIINLARKLRLA
ncbi:MAG: phosphatase PAP2 family protein [Patescibacteria group bacterium]|jgi:undecaprenyl-diphosphatase